jgi:hypothetical protein
MIVKLNEINFNPTAKVARADLYSMPQIKFVILCTAEDSKQELTLA